MAKETISAVVTENPEKGIERMEASVEYDFGDTLEQMVEKYTEPVVKSKVHQKLTIDLQAYMRGLLRAGKSQDEITAAVQTWKPGLSKPKKSPIDKIADMWDKMTEDEQNELLEKLGS